MSTESQLREKLRKIEALFAGAGTAGEGIGRLRVDTIQKSDSKKRTAADGLCRRRPLRELLLPRFRCLLDSAHYRSPLQ
jgi:hypothetical protein